MKKLITIPFLIVAFVVSGLAQDPCNRYAPAGAGFSICTPAGWTLKDEADSNFKSVNAPASSATPANLLFVVDNSSQLALKAYVDGTNDYSLKNFAALGFSSMKLDSLTDSVTDTKEHGLKTVLLEEMNGNKLLGVQYTFEIGSKKLLVTFTTLESGRAAYETIFDAAVKSLKIDH